MTSTAVPMAAAAKLRHLASAESTPATSTDISPIDSPRSSRSSTSLSSLASEDVRPDKTTTTAAAPAPAPAAAAAAAAAAAPSSEQKLVDAYGNRFEIPDFTINDIHRAIPKHCFERSAATGLYYVARDIVMLGITFYLTHKYVTPENVPSAGLRAALWALYTVVQGLVGTGLWVMAHECGHQSFSPSKTLNDTVGWICHSALLVPYFSWKISHSKHHKATGHMERDMAFVPVTREEYATRRGLFIHQLTELTEDAPIVTLFWLVAQQVGGWPMYLLANVTGHNKHENQKEGRGKGKKNGLFTGVNHFNPSSPLYDNKEAHLILLSDLGIAITLSVLYWIGSTWGWTNLLVWYVIPYLWVNNWLVAITFLQHTDPSLPHYSPETWTYTRGAAATIDREAGFIGRHLWHGIVETHVLHHYVSTIPFYNADEATEAIKPVMGKHYRSDTREGPWGFLKSMYRNFRSCQWVEPLPGTTGENAGVLFFRNRNNLNLPPQVLKEGEQLPSPKA